MMSFRTGADSAYASTPQPEKRLTLVVASGLTDYLGESTIKATLNATMDNDTQDRGKAHEMVQYGLNMGKAAIRQLMASVDLNLPPFELEILPLLEARRINAAERTKLAELCKMTSPSPLIIAHGAGRVPGLASELHHACPAAPVVFTHALNPDLGIFSLDTRAVGLAMISAAGIGHGIFEAHLTSGGQELVPLA